jgi:Baseplate J-like protein
MSYIDVPVETEPVDLAGSAFDYIETKVPGWLPSPGNLESWLVESLAQIAGELRELVGLVPQSIFEFYGETILGLPPYEAVEATGVTSWTAIDTAGYTVNAGTLVAVRPPASLDAYAFEVVDAFTIPSGQTALGGVTIRALEAGTAASGITGAVEMIDVLDFISQVTLVSPTSGGVDAETTDAYLDRLSDLLTLLAPRPILALDFAVLAQREIPGVARCCAIDLYNLSTATAGVARCVTVVPVDSAGEACSAVIKNEIDALLQAQREVNFLAFVGDPTYTTIDCAFNITVYPDHVVSDVVNRTIANLTSYLSPQNWGLPPYGDTSARSWINDTTVRWLEVAEQINRTDGVHYINTLTINKSGQTPGTANVVMTGIAPLPRAGAITGTGTGET